MQLRQEPGGPTSSRGFTQEPPRLAQLSASQRVSAPSWAPLAERGVTGWGGGACLLGEGDCPEGQGKPETRCSSRRSPSEDRECFLEEADLELSLEDG